MAVTLNKITPLHKITPLLTTLVLMACSTPPGTAQEYLSKKQLYNQTPSNFTHCHAYGCQSRTQIELSTKDWTQIDTAFTPPAQTPEEERAQIKTAIALFEQKVGYIAGTHEDIKGTFKKTGTYQLDCVDESTNTTTYLALLKQRNHLHFHDVMSPAVRLPIIHAGRWPHQTAVIKEIGAKTLYAVDSWFHDNGISPEIVPLDLWKEGWKPDQNTEIR